ncbi:MAG: chemotaxis protein CheW [Pyrinomonadaceae bacterium]
MTDRATDFADLSILPRTLGLIDDAAASAQQRERREMLVVRSGARLLGVFADEAGSVTKWIEPTPLPRAPAAVLGVVSIRGGMLTLLDPLALLGERKADVPLTPAFIVALRGDEQLALAVDRVERIIEIFTDEVEPLARSDAASLLRGLVGRERELIAVLDLKELFSNATRGNERRRQRS